MRNFKQSSFHRASMIKQIIWRKANISTQEHGIHSNDKETGIPKKYAHIVPKELWKETLWSGIRKDLLDYIEKPGMEIHIHDETHNLLSSWVLCANLYFLIRTNDHFNVLMSNFLREKVSERIINITDVNLEFAFPDYDELHPNPLLGETTGTRGKKQTSPDIAFFVNTTSGIGTILVEVKYTEQHFYSCSTNPENNKNQYSNSNPDFSRCMQSAKGYDFKEICHQKHAWHRKYFDLIMFSESAESTLACCPAATDGYQLFRHQALAEGIAKSGRFDLVASVVAFDGENKDLISCMKTTGITDFQTGWAPLFKGKSIFKSWTHQEWVQFVRNNQVNQEFQEWLEYVETRYGY